MTTTGVAEAIFHFDRFALDPDQRRLSADGAPAELNARYLDALILLVREHGQLVSKDRFLDEVWKGVPVTDEALTQCIRTLRRVLGDTAAHPRFIETVPKYGYRFVAPLRGGEGVAAAAPVVHAGATPPLQHWLLLGLAGTVGAGLAGTIGGLFYGFAGAAQPGAGALSIMLVLLCVTVAIALIGGAGVAFGIAAARMLAGPGRWWEIIGGALGGLVIGASFKLLGLDAFQLLLGRSPGDITGAGEGVLIGAAVGLSLWVGERSSILRSIERRAAVAALIGGWAGIAIGLAGGRLMGGSLDQLAQHMPGARFRIDPIGQMFGEDAFGPLSRIVTGGLEGALFAGCLVAAMLLAARRIDERG